MVVHGQPCVWEALNGATFSGRIRAIKDFDEGSEPRLFAGGGFSRLLGSPASNLARWDLELWSQVGAGVSGSVYSLAIFDDGSGPGLYAGGAIWSAGGTPGSTGVARWDGAEWSALGTGIRNFTDPPSAHNAAAMVAFDDGSGPSLFVGGRFTEAGGIPALNVARWDGHQWHAMGDGLYGYEVRAMVVYDGGAGPALYAGGYVGTGVARWNGTSWSDVGEAGAIEAMAVFDDGSGPALYAGGQIAGGIKRWDGQQWSVVGAGSDYDVRSLHVFDDGTGPALYAGPFPHPSGEFGVARWDGREWAPVGPGLYDRRGISVDAMATFDDGAGPMLYIAGLFTEAGGVTVNHTARLRCFDPCPADCDRSGELDFFDFLCFQNDFAAQDPAADCDESGELDFFDFLCFQNAFAAGCP